MQDASGNRLEIGPKMHSAFDRDDPGLLKLDTQMSEDRAIQTLTPLAAHHNANA